jgi:hypothetical protein
MLVSKIRKTNGYEEESKIFRTGPEAPVDGKTTMSSESVRQVARSWVDVGRFHMRLFGVLYVTCGDFHDESD